MTNVEIRCECMVQAVRSFDKTVHMPDTSEILRRAQEFERYVRGDAVAWDGSTERRQPQ